jgi:hypothetical protein
MIFPATNAILEKETDFKIAIVDCQRVDLHELGT